MLDLSGLKVNVSKSGIRDRVSRVQPERSESGNWPSLTYTAIVPAVPKSMTGLLTSGGSVSMQGRICFSLPLNGWASGAHRKEGSPLMVIRVYSEHHQETQSSPATEIDTMGH